MAKNNALFSLIKSLSRSEKRYFKLFAARSGRPTNYIRLFEAIEKQEDYDEAALRKQFAGESFMRQLHVTKNYLSRLILKSLRNFHAGISKKAEVKDALRNVEILFHKELYGHCKRELKKARHTAEQFEIDECLVEILAWQRKIEQVQEPQNYAGFAQTIQEQQKAIERLANTNKYWELAVGVSSALLSGNKQQLPGEEELLNTPDSALSLEARVLHYNAKYFRCLATASIGDGPRCAL